MNNSLQEYARWKNLANAECSRRLRDIEKNTKEIDEAFAVDIEFGTAGMRGIISDGTNRMNEYTIKRATKGLAGWINSLNLVPKHKIVVVCYDTRNMSYEFALTASRVLSACGINVKLFENVRPVPICSFAVRHFSAIAGIMITASHNPKEYNGYKVYGSDGAQMDLDATEKVVNFIKQADYFDVQECEVKFKNQSAIIGKDKYMLSDKIEVVGKSVDKLYFKEILKLCLSKNETKQAKDDVKIVYTPIHGAGFMPVTTVYDQLGINYLTVKEQECADGNFPTVKVPNPEQPDALAMGIELAKQTNADVVIGTDPDCDRMGVAIKNNNGEFILLTGNQIGSLLFDYVLMRNQQLGKLKANGAGVKSIVTTKLADKIAQNYNIKLFTVLTGFKFIGEKIKSFEQSGDYSFVFGFEESYGYLCGTHARDKDAVVSSMLFAEMVFYFKANNITIYEQLESLYKKYGYYVESSTSIEFKGLDGMQNMQNIMQELRQNPIKIIDGLDVEYVADYGKATKTFASGKVEQIALPKTNAIEYAMADNVWVTVRPSGTEPKLKIYTGVVSNSKQTAQDSTESIKNFMLKKFN